jgi:hypothetical protein
MSCNNLKPPAPPSIENLPSNIKPPAGGSIDNIKSAASGKGLSNAMSNVGGLVSSNLKNAASALSPENIASKVGELVGGIANTITSTVDGVIDGISGLKGQLKSLNPKAKLSQADKLKADVAGKANGVGEMSEFQSKLSDDACSKKYISQASDVNKGMTESATSAMKNVSRKDRAKMARDPDFKQQKSQEIQDKVKSDASDKATGAAAAKDKDQIDVQEKTQQPTLVTAKKTPQPERKTYVDSWISKLVTISAADDSPNARWNVFDEMWREFLTKLQTGGLKDGTITDGYDAFHPDLVISKTYTYNPHAIAPWVLGLDTFNSRELTGVFARQCGQTKSGDTSWADNPELSDPIRMMAVFRAFLLESQRNPVAGAETVVVNVEASWIHTTHTPNPIFGRYFVTSIGFDQRRAQAKTALDAYKAAVKGAFETKYPSDLEKQLYSV